MIKKFLLIFLLFCLNCQNNKYSLDYIFLWKEPTLKKNVKLSYLGIQKDDKNFYSNAGEISSLAIEQNKEIFLELELGEDPFFLFYPLTRISNEESIEYVISIFFKDRPVKKFNFKLKYQIPPAPQRILVNLKKFENKKVKMVLMGSVEGRKDLEIVFGSPFIIQKIKNKINKINKTNFLLISIDTFRADALGTYGRKPSITPNIDSFSKEADTWLNCYSTSNKTNPSFCSILSGFYSKHHGIYNLIDPLPSNILTLPEIFKKNDYETIAVVSAFHLHSGANLCSRFSRYKVSEETYSTEEAIFESINFLKNIEKPFFLWLHIFDPHTPHTAPEPFFSGYYGTKKFDYFPFNDFKKQRYNGHLNYIDLTLLANPEMYYDEVAYMDFSLGFLFNFLEKNNYFKNTVIAFISDHGENLNEHGNVSDHGGLWKTTTHIPLMLKIPDKKNYEKFNYFVQSIDLFPTILRIFKLGEFKNDGRDLYIEKDNERSFTFAEALEENEIMVRSKKYLFKMKKNNGLLENFLFDTKNDPKELVNIYKEKKELSENYIEILNLFLKDKIQIKNKGTLSEEEIKKLKSLGYLY